MADKIRVLLTEEEVDKRINEVAERINKDYAGKSIHLICILKGGVFFTCELATPAKRWPTASRSGPRRSC